MDADEARRRCWAVESAVARLVDASSGGKAAVEAVDEAVWRCEEGGRGGCGGRSWSRSGGVDIVRCECRGKEKQRRKNQGVQGKRMTRPAARRNEGC